MKHTLLALLLVYSQMTLLSAQTTHACTAGGVTRSYIKYVPASAPVSGAPLVFVLHGFTQTGQAIMGISNFNALADQYGFIVCYPNGLNNSWYIGATGAGTDDVAFLGQLIDTISLYHPVNAQRVYACGMSNGGYLSYKLACEQPNRYAAIASVTGAMTTQILNSCAPNKPVPVLEIHGTADAIVPYNGSTANIPVLDILNFWNSNNSCSTTATTETELPNTANEGSSVTRFLYDPCASSTYSTVEHLRINNGGHTWAGTSSLFSGLGNVNQDISASAKIWEFFDRFSLQNSTAEEEILKPIGNIVYLYPNPASGEYLKIQSDNYPIHTVQLSSVEGRIHKYQTTNQPYYFEIPLKYLQNGFYTLHVSTTAGVVTKKLIIQNH